MGADGGQEQGAVFGESMGWERPKWFDTEETGETLSFSRNGSFAAVARECQAVRDAVGIFDLSSMTKIEASGIYAAEFLNRIFANDIPKKVGGIALCHLLNRNGFFEAEMIVTLLEEGRYLIISAGGMRARDFDQLQQLLTPFVDVDFSDVTDEYGCLALAGPKSREVLAKLTGAELTNAAFPWMSAQQIIVAGSAVTALRVSYAGELGWELYIPMTDLAGLYESLLAAGTEFGIVPVGLYALNSLRMEKGFRGFGTELTNEVTPIHADMTRYVSKRKTDFLGQKALARAEMGEDDYRLIYCEVGTSDLDVMGSEPIYSGDEIVGLTTSGGFGHCSGTNLAFGYVKSRSIGQQLEVEMLGNRYKLKLLTEPVIDPKSQRPRT